MIYAKNPHGLRALLLLGVMAAAGSLPLRAQASYDDARMDAAIAAPQAEPAVPQAPEPPHAESEPAAAEPAPAVVQPAPPAAESAPAVAGPEPLAVEADPAVAESAPTAAAPQPAVAPAIETPAPPPAAPVTAMMPVTETPAARDEGKVEAPPPPRPEPTISAGILVDGLEYGLDMPWGNEAFEKYRQDYLSAGGRKWLQAVMEKSLVYIAYVDDRVRHYGLPLELAFLPVIESEYSPHAVSRSGATGLWQFMRNSIAGYGMKITDWVDERRDFMKSTDGALQKLADNYAALGDWPLALAAYNAGMGAVSRARKTSGDVAGYWELAEAGKLSREARSYVPKFLAVASILRYPALHGLPGEWGEPHSWETLRTDRQVDLALLSQRAGIPLAQLKSGNAELRYHITPPSASHVVKVPAEKAEAAKAVLDDKSQALVRYTIYKVKSGDTMSQIAARAGTPLSMILQANPGLKADKIRIGQTVLIPVLDGGSAKTAKAPAKSVSAKSSPSKSAPASKASDDDALEFSSSYTVRPGDTLWMISLKYDIQPDLLASANDLSLSSVLRIGQKLKVPMARD